MIKVLRNTEKRAKRRSYPIHGYVGSNGGGKSAAMVWDTLPSLAAGRPVLGTVRIVDYENPRDCEDDYCANDPTSGHFVRENASPQEIHDLFSIVTDPIERVELLADLGPVVGVHAAAHPLWIRLTSWSQVRDFRGGDLLLDEVTGGLSSRDSMSLPSVIANGLVQMRRRDVLVRYSSPAFARADKILRETSQAVTWCKGFMPKELPSADGAERVWTPRRLFKWKTYDAQEFDDFGNGKRQDLDPLLVDWHYGPGSPAFRAYNTFDAVFTVGTVTETGTCLACSGSRRRQECGCPDYLAEKSSRRRVSAAVESAA